MPSSQPCAADGATDGAAAGPAIGVGTWAWGNQLLWGYDPAADGELRATFQRAVALGLRLFDTADSYGSGRFNGRSESLLGAFAAELPPAERQRLLLATKLAPFPWRLGRRGFARAFAASRRRLQGKVDRVQLHWSTARYAPWQEGPLLAGLADLVLAGAVPELGVSNMGPRRLRRLQAELAARGVPLRSLQVQLSLLAPAALAPGGVAEVCRELGIELIAYSPLALGLLARPAAATPPPLAGPRGLLLRRLWPGLQPMLHTLAEIAAARRSSPAAVALNWCRSHGAIPIPGLRRVEQVELAAAARTWLLSSQERQALDAQAWRLAAAGVAMPANPFQSA
ncbi:MAG: aldo/keto reductase [Synechococcaceae cyanobacterium]|nr:aldo/keto reductase [Synechococcaceae cyanobacterium]